MANIRFGGRRRYYLDPGTPPPGVSEAVQVFRRDPFRRRFFFLDPSAPPPAVVECIQVFRRDPFRRHFYFLAPSDTPPPPVPTPTGNGSGGSGGGRRPAFDFDKVRDKLRRRRMEKSLLQIITIVWLSLQPKDKN